MSRILNLLKQSRFPALAAVLALIIPVANISAQEKVGPSQSTYLLFSTSARINAMGEAGVALSDGFPAFHNPAALAFPSADKRFRIAFWPSASDAAPQSHYTTETLGHFGLSTNILRANPYWNLSVGYSRARWNLWGAERDALDGTYEETGRVFKAKTVVHCFTAGLA